MSCANCIGIFHLSSVILTAVQLPEIFRQTRHVEKKGVDRIALENFLLFFLLFLKSSYLMLYDNCFYEEISATLAPN